MWEVYGSWPSWCTRPGTDGQTPAERFLVRGTALAGMSSVQARERGVDSDPTHWGRATQHHPITLPHSTQTAASSPFPEHAQARVWGLSVCRWGHMCQVLKHRVFCHRTDAAIPTDSTWRKKIREKLALQRPTQHRFTAYVNYGCSVCWPFLTAGPL